MAVFNYFFGFSGRITRLHWWIGGLSIGLICALAIFAIMFSAAATLPPEPKAENHEAMLAWLSGHALGLLVVLVLPFVSQISLTMRRYRDRGKSGVWVLLGFLPLALFALSIASPLWFFVAVPLSLIIPIWQLIELGCLAGTPGSNDYGPDPREGGLDGLAGEIAAMDRYANIDFARYASSPAPQPALGAATPVRRGPPAFGKRA